ncbi:MAG: dihydroorotate dehydrogenase [Deltaproteobacteria bacterium]|nr:dihydroorotate dehydrogenase [Deltaproteobacteria bacterium]
MLRRPSLQPMGTFPLELFGKKLRNPVMNASGTLGYGKEIERLWKISTLGAFVTKGLSVFPHKGNPQPRILDLGFGMLNSIGLQNFGIKRFLEEYTEFFIRRKTPVILNIFGFTEDEYVECGRLIGENPAVLALEANLSCPNVKQGGIIFGKDPKIVGRIVRGLKSVTKIPVLVKLSSEVTDIVEIAYAAYEAGADGLTLINTLPGMWKERDTLVRGGISGPFLKFLALKAIYDCKRSLPIPIVGAGGIMNVKDAILFLEAGCSAIQVGTATFLDPLAIPKIVKGLKAYFKRGQKW